DTDAVYLSEPAAEVQKAAAVALFEQHDPAYQALVVKLLVHVSVNLGHKMRPWALCRLMSEAAMEDDGKEEDDLRFSLLPEKATRNRATGGAGSCLRQKWPEVLGGHQVENLPGDTGICLW
ncbi:hypothetical protein VaNZ11_008168, partial [Volvox africanus]